MELKSGKRVERDVHFAGGAAEFVTAHAFEKIGGQFEGSRNFSKVRCGSTLEETTLAQISSPDCSTTPVARPFLTTILSTGALRANFDAGFARGGGDGVGNRAGAAAAESPGAERAINFAHVVMQEERRRCPASECQEMCR